MERRRLFGRRYEDYVRNNVSLELTPEEVSWRIILGDPRYRDLINRRRGLRRRSEKPIGRRVNLHRSTVNLKSLEAIRKEESGLL